MKEIAIDKVLTEKKFSEKEKDAFLKMLKYAQVSMETNKENVKLFINNQLNEVIKNEI